MNLETTNLKIRDFLSDDVEELYEILGDIEVMRYMEPAYDRNKTITFLNEFCIKEKGAFACIHKNDNKLIGYLLFNTIEDNVYEIGWAFNKKYWGKGYAYEACESVIKYAFDEIKVHKIFAETIDNKKSIGLMKKLGMNLEGVLKSHTLDNDCNWCDVYMFGIVNN